MTSFPRETPDELKLLAAQFILKPTGVRSPVRGGQQLWADTGASLWHVKFESPNLSKEQFGVVQAWYDTILFDREFYAYDVHREYPLAHAAGWGNMTEGGSPFDGTVLIAAGSSGFNLNLKSCPTDLVFTAGDMLAFEYGGSPGDRALHRIVASVGSGGTTRAVEVRPALRTGFATDDIVQLYRPSARMIILPDTYSAVQAVDGTGRISFEAVQSL